MYINQISVFVENKPGRLFELTNFLAEQNINLRALEVADASDHGIIRIIVDDPFATLNTLKENDWVCKLTEVVGVKIPDEPGSMAKISKILSDADVNVEYCYAFLAKDSNDALLILKVTDNENVMSIFKENNIALINQDDLANA
ncbi:MAG: ACT domain-containing protein [Eubacterium sp.]|nr:ACT domain-containing protein [Eubacterium sp.]